MNLMFDDDDFENLDVHLKRWLMKFDDIQQMIDDGWLKI